VLLQDLSPRKQVEACAKCHVRKVVMRPGYQPGGEFFDYHTLGLMDDNLVMPDGRYNGLMYVGMSFFQSACFEKGGLTCTKCHDPHGSGLVNDLRKFKSSDEMCLPCHADIVKDPTPHTFHKKESQASRCIECHLRKHPISRQNLADHTLSSPVPENTIRYNSPNACNDCHKDKTAQWSLKWVKQWYGSARKDRWSRADILFKAKSMDTSAVMPLCDMLSDTSENFIWRANAALMLGGLRDRRAVPTLLAHIHASDPVIRWNVVNSLTKLADARVFTALGQAIQTERNPLIRILVAGTLGYWWRKDLSPPEQRIADETWKLYVEQVTTSLGDWPDARRSYAEALMRRGDLDGAKREFGYAIQLDRKDALAEDGLTALHTIRNEHLEALSHGLRAIDLKPDNAGFHVNLARVYLNLDKLPEAEKHLRTAIRLDPRVTWPMMSWKDHTPKTTPTDVLTLSIPTELKAALDSAAKWSQRANYRFMRKSTRMAYVDHAITCLAPFSADNYTGETRRTILRLTGYAYASKAHMTTHDDKAPLLAHSLKALSAIDTMAIRDNVLEKRKLGGAWFALARAYDYAQDYQACIPAFKIASRYLPGTFADAIGWFFIGTAHDRLGQREQAIVAHKRSATHPANSVRGVRCSIHLLTYPFKYVPEKE
jgi:predicted CXXCH cytochrome family protein